MSTAHERRQPTQANHSHREHILVVSQWMWYSRQNKLAKEESDLTCTFPRLFPTVEIRFAVKQQAFAAGREEEGIRTFWHAARQKETSSGRIVTTTYQAGVKLTKEAMEVVETHLQRLSSLEKWFVDIPYNGWNR